MLASKSAEIKNLKAVASYWRNLGSVVRFYRGCCWSFKMPHSVCKDVYARLKVRQLCAFFRRGTCHEIIIHRFHFLCSLPWIIFFGLSIFWFSCLCQNYFPFSSRFPSIHHCPRYSVPPIFLGSIKNLRIRHFIWLLCFQTRDNVLGGPYGFYLEFSFG